MPNKLPYPEPPKGVRLIVWIDYRNVPNWPGKPIEWLVATWDGKHWKSRDFVPGAKYRPSEINIVAWEIPTMPKEKP